MYKLIGFCALLCVFSGCQNKGQSVEGFHPLSIVSSEGVDIGIYDFEAFEPYLSLKDDKVHIVNFWATWCAPCVKELPAFEKLNSIEENVDVVLVSMDFPNTIEKSLIPFILKRDIKSKVILLDDSNENEWIPKVDAGWKGAIPVTIIYSKRKKTFYERSFTFEELQIEINKFTNK